MPEYQSRLELLARVASLYYDKERNQQEIADEIGLTLLRNFTPSDGGAQTRDC